MSGSRIFLLQLGRPQLKAVGPIRRKKNGNAEWPHVALRPLKKMRHGGVRLRALCVPHVCQT